MQGKRKSLFFFSEIFSHLQGHGGVRLHRPHRPFIYDIVAVPRRRILPAGLGYHVYKIQGRVVFFIAAEFHKVIVIVNPLVPEPYDGGKSVDADLFNEDAAAVDFKGLVYAVFIDWPNLISKGISQRPGMPAISEMHTVIFGGRVWPR